MALQNSFMLHCGAKETTLDDVRNAVVPARTRTYVPLGHYRYQQLIRDNLTTAGYQITDELHSLTPDDQRYFGGFEVLPPSWADEDNLFRIPDEPGNEAYLETQIKQALVVGFRNGHGGRMTSAFGIGMRMFICDNLMFQGDITVMRKHTAKIIQDLPDLVSNGIAKIPQSVTKMVGRYDGYKATEISKITADHIVVEALRKNLIASSQVKKIVQTFAKPPRDWNATYDTSPDSLWNLFNSFTWNLKPKSPQKAIEYPRRTARLHNVFDGFVTAGETRETLDAQWRDAATEEITPEEIAA